MTHIYESPEKNEVLQLSSEFLNLSKIDTIQTNQITVPESGRSTAGKYHNQN